MKGMLKLYGYRDPPSYGITSEFIDLLMHEEKFRQHFCNQS